ncbi:hypothetical protein VTN00DRAFT_8152 [Thermoascus crustaceus]|uniref:uncharacterized protein n=1 Tax=Thermoascus crustaceus TaxID=5088 RepID=UPI003741FE8A
MYAVHDDVLFIWKIRENDEIEVQQLVVRSWEYPVVGFGFSRTFRASLKFVVKYMNQNISVSFPVQTMYMQVEKTRYDTTRRNRVQSWMKFDILIIAVWNVENRAWNLFKSTSSLLTPLIGVARFRAAMLRR